MISVYDFNDITLIVDGTIISGFADGDAITKEANEDSHTYQEGAGGDGEYTTTNKRSESLTINLQRTSPSNPVLRDLFLGKKQFSVQLIDHNDNAESWSATHCMIPRNATYAAGSEASPREWTIILPRVD